MSWSLVLVVVGGLVAGYAIVSVLMKTGADDLRPPPSRGESPLRDQPLPPGEPPCTQPATFGLARTRHSECRKSATGHRLDAAARHPALRWRARYRSRVSSPAGQGRGGRKPRAARPPARRARRRAGGSEATFLIDAMRAGVAAARTASPRATTARRHPAHRPPPLVEDLMVTLTERVVLPPSPVQESVKVASLASADETSVPVRARAPLQSPLAEQMLASVVDQLRVVFSLRPTDAGLADNITVGADAVLASV